MNNWNEYLTTQGARHCTGTPGLARDFGRTLTAAELAAGFVAVIGSQGLIEVAGEDAATFLHSQLTNDVEHLGADEVRLAGYCSPKGRLQASFHLWRNPDAVMLQLARDLQPALQKRLSMFVLRAKAKLVDASPGKVLLGFGGATAGPALQQLFGTLPGGPYARIEYALGTLLRVADAFGFPRYQWIATETAAQAAWAGLTASLVVAGDDAWQLSSIHAGVPHIVLATQDQFVPQMVNYELLGAVNFKKGCYPGQEIVARSQYLGKLKRRTALATVAADALPAAEVFSAADPDQPCGMIVNAAPNGEGGTDVLVEIKLAAMGSSVHLGAADGPALTFLTMPYPLDALEL